MFLVDKQTSNGARTRVYVLVIAPSGKVDVPVVKLQFDISSCMSQIPANRNTVRMSMGSDCCYVKALSRIILNTGE